MDVSLPRFIWYDFEAVGQAQAGCVHAILLQRLEVSMGEPGACPAPVCVICNRVLKLCLSYTCIAAQVPSLGDERHGQVSLCAVLCHDDVPC